MNASSSNQEGEHREVLVSIDAGPESAPEEVEELSKRLRKELLKLDIESITPTPGLPAPKKAKADAPASWVTLVLALAASGGVLTTVIGTMRDWLLRQSTPLAIEVSIDGDSIRLERSSTHERQQLIDAFISRHGRDPG